MNTGYLDSFWQDGGSVAAGQTFTLIKLPVTLSLNVEPVWNQSQKMTALHLRVYSRNMGINTYKNRFIHAKIILQFSTLYKTNQYPDTAKCFL